MRAVPLLAGLGVLVAPLIALLIAAGTPDDVPTFGPSGVARIASHTDLAPPPDDPTNRWADDARAARLGQALFFDARLSASGEHSCASCHDPARGFADGRPVALGGPDGTDEGTRNAPSLWNVGYQRWFFWDGRADSLWAQVAQPLESPIEMAGSRLRLARTIARDAELREAYERLFGPLPEVALEEGGPADACPIPDDPDDPRQRAWDALGPERREDLTRVLVHASKAIAAYERKLVSRDSAFDRFARGLKDGDPGAADALSPAAQHGLALFVTSAGCRQCHVGPNFTDDEFHDLGLAPRGGGLRADPGRNGGIERLLSDPLRASSAYSDDPAGPAARELDFLARNVETWGQFKTPSLRNVALSAPYGHDGAFATLADVVRFYSTLEGSAPAGHHGERVLEPLGLSERDMADLVAFLESLTDEGVDPALLAPPPSPLLD